MASDAVEVLRVRCAALGDSPAEQLVRRLLWDLSPPGKEPTNEAWARVSTRDVKVLAAAVASMGALRASPGQGASAEERLRDCAAVPPERCSDVNRTCETCACDESKWLREKLLAESRARVRSPVATAEEDIQWIDTEAKFNEAIERTAAGLRAEVSRLTAERDRQNERERQWQRNAGAMRDGCIRDRRERDDAQAQAARQAAMYDAASARADANYAHAARTRVELHEALTGREREYQRAEVAEACVAAAWEALGYTHRAESESPVALGVAIESYGQRMVDESWDAAERKGTALLSAATRKADALLADLVSRWSHESEIVACACCWRPVPDDRDMCEDCRRDDAGAGCG
jgi:hypothetical protein